MKNIHPKIYKLNVICNCGNHMVIYSILKKKINIEICNLCYSYNNKKKNINKKHRIEKFNKKLTYKL